MTGQRQRLASVQLTVKNLHQKWEGHQVQSWAKGWVEERQLSESKRGCHAKVGSLLDDPAVATELKAYL